MPSIAELLAARKAAAAPTAPPPGKSTGGLVLTQSMPPEPSTPAPPMRPESRSLGQTVGEALDMTPYGATPEVAAWHSALCALTTELCVVRDPDPERAEYVWIALRLAGSEERPLLLHPLPMYDHPLRPRRPADPF